MASTKADEDDAIEDVLSKYKSQQSGEDVLKKSDAQEAAIELMEQKGKAGTMDQMEDVKKAFNEVWTGHDINNKLYIDYNEGFSLV